MPMLNPPHPGEVVKELCLEPLGLGTAQAAQGLGVSEEMFSRFLVGNDSVSPDLALRLSLAFGGSAESWLQQQAAWDLSQARRSFSGCGVTRFAASSDGLHA